MKMDLAAAMRRALAETRALDPQKATKTIQQALGFRATSAKEQPAARPRRSLRDVVDTLARRKRSEHPQPARPATPRTTAPVTDVALWEMRTHRTPWGERTYHLHVPASGKVSGLILMLHGCTQTGEDFAAGTRMNEIAAEQGLAVAWPSQTRRDNAQGCWNWFRPGDQARGAGEPALLAALIAALTEELGLSSEQVFVAGLSAGGAMAAVMAEAYPDLFAAVGIHSGLPTGRASDVLSAFAAMRGEAATAVARASGLRTIVFHGGADGTVHPSNGLAIAEAHWAGLTLRREEGQTAGRRFVRSVATGPDGTMAEHWLIEAAGHAWSGGSRDGSYADPSGPDASREMVRFFMETAR